MKQRHPEAPADDPGATRAVGPESGTAAEGPQAAAPGDKEGRAQELEAELARAVDARLRAEAELINARRRALKEIEDAERRAAERTLAPVLAVADDLDRALEAAAQAGDTEGPLARGVSLVLSRLLDTLAAEGVTPIVPAAEAFDPRLHEAFLHSPHPTIPSGHVAQVIARGWRHGDRLLRPARVLVSSGPPDAPDKD